MQDLIKLVLTRLDTLVTAEQNLFLLTTTTLQTGLTGLATLLTADPALCCVPHHSNAEHHTLQALCLCLHLAMSLKFSVK